MSSRPPRQILLALGVISCLVVAGGVGVAASGHPTKSAQSRSAHVKPALGAGTATRAVHVRTGLIRITDTSEVQPGTSDGLVLACPRRYPHTVSGFFDSTSDKVFLSQDRAEPLYSTRSRRWAIGVTNVGTTAAGWTAGVVCGRY